MKKIEIEVTEEEYNQFAKIAAYELRSANNLAKYLLIDFLRRVSVSEESITEDVVR